MSVGCSRRRMPRSLLRNVGRALNIRSDLPDPGTGHAIRRGDPNFPQAHAQRLKSSRALKLYLQIFLYCFLLISFGGIVVSGRNKAPNLKHKPDTAIALKSYRQITAGPMKSG